MDLVERRHGATNLRHPWERARRVLVGEIVEAAAASRGLRLAEALDIGSGDAWLAAGLAADLGLSHVDALDPAYTDEDLVELGTRTVTPVRSCPDRRYDVAFLLDVIEHVPDDSVLLRLARDHVVAGGLVMISVPAWPRLSTAHDQALGHYRRYTPARLRAAVTDAGLSVLLEGGAFTGLLPIRAVQRIAEHQRGRRDLPDLGEWGGGALVSSVVTAGLTWDARLGRLLAARGHPLPGLSAWALAERPRDSPA